MRTRFRPMHVGRRVQTGSSSANPFSPASLTNHVETWLGSSLGADASAIASWAGLTGTHTLLQGTGANQPVVASASGKKYAQFDGAAHFLEKAAYTQGSAAGYSIFAAIRIDADGSFPCVFGTSASIREFRCQSTLRQVEVVTDTGAGTVRDPGAISTATDYVIGCTTDFASDAVVIYRDGASVQTGTDNTNPVTSPALALTMGHRSGGALWFPGRVYALTYCEAALTPAQVSLLTAYLDSQMP